MDKKKVQQMIVLILIPAFLLSLLYTRLKGHRVKPAGHVEVKEDAQIDNIPMPQKPEPVRYEGGRNEPFKDLFLAYISSITIEAPTQEPEKPLPALNITGLLWNSDSPQAIINDKIVKIGDGIEGVKVLKIEKSGITVEHSGQAVFVPKAKGLEAKGGQRDEKMED